MMSHGSLQEALRLVGFVNLICRCDYFKSWHADLSIELLLDDVMASNFLDEIDLQWCSEVVITNDSGQLLIGDLPQFIHVQAEFDLIGFLTEAETLGERVLKLIFG